MQTLTGFETYLHRKGYSKQSIISYKARVQRFIQWLETKPKMPVTAISYNDILQYIESMKTRNVSMRSIQAELQGIQNYYRYLQATEQAIDNPVAYLKLQGVQQMSLYTILPYDILETVYNSYEVKKTYSYTVPPQRLQELARVRNKVMLGLLIYQGVNTTELQLLETKDVHVREGVIEIQGSRKSAYRKLKLQPFQVYELMEYMQVSRKELLQLTGKQTSQLFISTGSGTKLHNSIQKLMANTSVDHPNIKSINQIRASVIVHWLKHNNIRKVQYMAGHKYISATEAYKVYLTEGLADDVNRYFPIG